MATYESTSRLWHALCSTPASATNLLRASSRVLTGELDDAEVPAGAPASRCRGPPYSVRW